MTFGAVELIVLGAVVEDFMAHGVKEKDIVGTRWVFTNEARGGNQSNFTAADIKALVAKARLVVQGHQERHHEIRSDYPTASLQPRCHLCVSHVWRT